jgi:hypothetical protein
LEVSLLGWPMGKGSSVMLICFAHVSQFLPLFLFYLPCLLKKAVRHDRNEVTCVQKGPVQSTLVRLSFCKPPSPSTAYWVYCVSLNLRGTSIYCAIAHFNLLCHYSLQSTVPLLNSFYCAIAHPPLMAIAPLCPCRLMRMT